MGEGSASRERNGRGVTSTPSPVATAEMEDLDTKMADWFPYENLSDHVKEVQDLASGISQYMLLNAQQQNW